jgi:hypothetical protein
LSSRSSEDAVVAEQEFGPDDPILLVFRRAATPVERARALEFLGAPMVVMAPHGRVLYLLVDVAAARAGPPAAAAIVAVSNEAWTLEWMRAAEDHVVPRLANELAMAAVREGARALTWSSRRFGHAGELLRRALSPGRVVAGRIVIDL